MCVEHFVFLLYVSVSFVVGIPFKISSIISHMRERKRESVEPFHIQIAWTRQTLISQWAKPVGFRLSD